MIFLDKRDIGKTAKILWDKLDKNLPKDTYDNLKNFDMTYNYRHVITNVYNRPMYNRVELDKSYTLYENEMEIIDS